MKYAVVVGGWHWPLHFYRRMAQQAAVVGADLFVIAHRSPELPIVREEKREALDNAPGVLGDLDRDLYALYPRVDELRCLGWDYEERENTVGDWGFFNQWLERHDFRQYGVILNCHDDNYLRPGLLNVFHASELYGSRWLLCANGRYPQGPAGYVRGSFEFWRSELLEMLGGRIDLGDVKLTREGKTDTPVGLAALSQWNDTGVPLRDFLRTRGLVDRIQYLSQYYRVSPYVIEGERGFLHSNEGAPWSFEEGMRAYPVEAVAA